MKYVTAEQYLVVFTALERITYGRRPEFVRYVGTMTFEQLEFVLSYQWSPQTTELLKKQQGKVAML